MPRTSYIKHTPDHNPFQLAESPQQQPVVDPFTRKSKATPARDAPKAPSPALSPRPSLYRTSSSRSSTRTASPGSAQGAPLNDTDALAETAASLNFVDEPVSEKPVYGSPSSSLRREGSDSERAQAELKELREQNAQLQALLNGQQQETEYERVQRTQGSPTQDRRQMTFNFQRQIVKAEADAKQANESRAKLKKQHEDLKASVSSKDTIIEELRAALEIANKEKEAMNVKLHEYEEALSSVDARNQAQVKELEAQVKKWEANAQYFATEGQKVWDQLQQQTNLVKTTQMTLDYERQIMKSSEDSLKELRSRNDALNTEKRAVQESLKSARTDNERLYKDKQSTLATLSMKTGRVALLEQERRDLRKMLDEARMAPAPKQLGPEAVEASRVALAAQKSSKLLEALFYWAAVHAHLQYGDKDGKLLMTSTYNRASLLLDLTWQAIEKERLDWAQKDCATLLDGQPEYFKAHRLQARLYVQRKAYDDAAASFKSAIRFATAAGGDHAKFIKATQAELDKLKISMAEEATADASRKERKAQLEYEEFVRGRHADWQILGLSGAWGFTPQQVKQAVKMLANKYHPDKPNGNTRIMQRIFQARDNLLKKSAPWG